MKKTKTHSKTTKTSKTSKASKPIKAPVKTQKVAIKAKTPTKAKLIVTAKAKTQASVKLSPLKVEKVMTKKVQVEVKASPLAKPVQEKVVKAATVKAASEKSLSAKVQAQGNARVIEPLSWDAEKPKLNMMLTNKVSRKDKDKEEAEVKSYSFKSRYTVGDRVMHTDFGKGLVRDLIGDFKIRVAFRDFEKVLVHGIN